MYKSQSQASRLPSLTHSCWLKTLTWHSVPSSPDFRYLAASQLRRSYQRKLAGIMSGALVTGLVFLNDRCRNTAALADLLATLAGPLPNFGTALAARASSRLAPPCTAADTPCVLDVRAE